MREGSLCFCGAQPKSNDNNTTRDKGKTDLLSWSRASKQASNINQAGKQKKMATELGTNQLTSPFLPLPFPCPLKYKKTVPWANRRHSLFSLEGCEPPPPPWPPVKSTVSAWNTASHSFGNKSGVLLSMGPGIEASSPPPLWSSIPVATPLFFCPNPFFFFFFFLWHKWK